MHGRATEPLPPGVNSCAVISSMTSRTARVPELRSVSGHVEIEHHGAALRGHVGLAHAVRDERYRRIGREVDLYRTGSFAGGIRRGLLGVEKSRGQSGGQ